MDIGDLIEVIIDAADGTFISKSSNRKDFLIGTVFISGLGMIKINIDISEMKIIVFETKSFFDFMKKS